MKEVNEEGGAHYDTGKPRIGLLPPTAVFAIGRAMGYGAGKYADHNYRHGIKFSRLIDSIMRHLWAYVGGENTDPESGEGHVAHAGADVMMLLQMMHDHPELDDRFKCAGKPIKEQEREGIEDCNAGNRMCCGRSFGTGDGESGECLFTDAWEVLDRRDASNYSC